MITFGINHDEKDETSCQDIQLDKAEGVRSGMACKYMANTYHDKYEVAPGD